MRNFRRMIYKTMSGICAAVAGVCLTGCMSDFEPDIESTPVVCVNANAVAGTPLDIEVTRTWRWSEGVPDETVDIDLKEADVRLYVNGALRAVPVYSTWNSDRPWWNMGWRSKGSGYRTDYVPQPGDHIRITVHDDRYGDAEGEVTVPCPVPITGMEFTTQTNDSPSYNGVVVIRPTDPDRDKRVTTCYGNAMVRVGFSDPAGVRNYYKVELQAYSDTTAHGMYDQVYFDFDSEPLFTEHITSLESIFSDTSGYTFFSDRQIAGQPYSLHLGFENLEYEYLTAEGPQSNRAGVRITLMSISESYYKNVISMWQSNDGVPGTLGGLGIGDPVWEASNVSTGAGVISACASSEYRLPLSALFSL